MAGTAGDELAQQPCLVNPRGWRRLEVVDDKGKDKGKGKRGLVRAPPRREDRGGDAQHRAARAVFPRSASDGQRFPQLCTELLLELSNATQTASAASTACVDDGFATAATAGAGRA